MFLWKEKAQEKGVDDDTIEKLKPIINAKLTNVIYQERVITSEVSCPYCMKQDNQLKAVAGEHGEFVTSVACACGKQFRVFGHRTIIIDKIEGET